MWLKPPQRFGHVCDMPPLDRVCIYTADASDQGCIWRCDQCLKVYVLKISDQKTHSGKDVLVWRSYDFYA